jgi:hypothetical protein
MATLRIYGLWQICHSHSPVPANPNGAGVTDYLNSAINQVLNHAISNDLDLAEQAAAVDLATVVNRLAPGRPVNPDKLLALVRDQLDPDWVADQLGIDPGEYKAWLASPDEEIEIDPAWLRNFDDVFGDPPDDDPGPSAA